MSPSNEPSQHTAADVEPSSSGPASRDFGGEAPPSLEPGAIGPPPKSSEVRRNLGAGRGSGLRRWLFRLGLLLVLAAAVAGVLWWRAQAEAAPKYEWITKPVSRGNLEGSITATGSLQGRGTVEVGAEVSGTVKAVHVDFNDEVKKGKLLCEIDPEQLAAALDQTRAQLMAAQAEYSTRQVTATEAELAAERSRKLAADGLVSQQQLEAAVAAADRAKASVRSAKAQITVARASVESARTKLGKTKIVAPLDGVVLARSVEVGQTVAASLQAPVLFTLARSLTEMELTVAIDEADIGQVKQGLPATFVVDAFPERTFEAGLQRIHNIGTTVDSVVTYQALLSVKNDDRSLRPGMTATATIVTASRKGVLLVPNAALRFSPPRDESASGGPRMPGIRMRGMPRRRRPKSTSSASPSGSAKPGRPGGGKGRGPRVWVVRDGKPKPVRVKTGMSDGTMTEIIKGKLEEGTEVITDMQLPKE